MSKDHKENLNLLFYDFNHLAHDGDEEQQCMEENTRDIGIEANTLNHGGKFAGQMTNTGINFFTRFGDRLPTRETKSRKGRTNYIAS